MKRKRKPEVTGHSPYNGFKVKANLALGYYLYQPILVNTFCQTDAMLDRCRKVLTFRKDLHLPDDFNGSDLDVVALVSKLFDSVTGHLKKTPKKARSQPNLRNHKYVAYQWCIERGKKGKYHIHCWIAVDGSTNSKPGRFATERKPSDGLVGLIETKWKKLTGGTLYLVDNPRMLTRTDRKLYE